jgi:hypothetical protein
MNVQELNQKIENGEVKLHHTALARGYVSRKTDGHVNDYSGYFGKGYAHYKPNFESTRYCYVTYYIFD